MSDELLIPTEVAPEEPVAEAPAEAEKPSITKEQIAEALGLDPDDIDKVKNLKKWEKELNRTSTEIGQLRKQAAPEPKSDDGYEVTDEQVKMMRALLKAATGVDAADLASTVTGYRMTATEALDDTTTDFFASHTDVTEEQVFAKIAELGVSVDGITPRRAKALLTEARKSILADAPAPDYEAEVQKRLAAALEEKMKELAPKDGETVLEVRPKKGAPVGGHKSVEELADDPNISFFDKMDATQNL